MNKLSLTLGVLLVAGTRLHGQGTVLFSNIGVPVTNFFTWLPVPAGSRFLVALYYLPDLGFTPTQGDFDSRALQLGTPASFFAPGLFSGGTRTTPDNTPPGGMAWFQVRIWESAYGTSYEQAQFNPILIGGRPSQLGFSNIFKIPTGPPIPTPLFVPGGLQPFCAVDPFPVGGCIPEPSTIALAMLGVGALLLRGQRARMSRIQRKQDEPSTPSTL
jgi:hypothetical protein